MALSMRPASRMPVSKKGKKKSDEAQNVLDRLEAFLDEKVPGLVKQLASFLALQAAAVTHKQLRSFVAEEDSPDSLIPDWRHDYAVLAAGKLADGWREALTAGMRAVTPGSGSAQGHEDIDTRQGTDARPAGPAESGTLFPDLLTPGGGATSQPHVPTGGAGTLLTPTPIPPSGGSTVIYSPTDEKIRNWINTRAGELITNSTNEQVEAIRHILMESKANQMSVEETARLIRPTIGLTRPQAASNLKYYNSVKESLRKEHPRMKEESIEKKAREAAEKYAQKQIRYRAQLIAETELAFAYNYGHHEAIREGMASGKLPLMREIWSTANNGHVCESCQDLEGMEVGFDEEFSVEVHSKRNPERVLRTLKTTVPPLHPRCHCAIQYVEAPQVKQNEAAEEDKHLSIDMNLQLFGNGKDRANEYAAGWPEGSLTETIERFAKDAVPLYNNQKGKIIYQSERSSIAVVYDYNGKYFRVEDTSRSDRRRFLDLDGNDVSNKNENGRITGRSKSEYQRITHFKNIDEWE